MTDFKIPVARCKRCTIVMPYTSENFSSMDGKLVRVCHDCIAAAHKRYAMKSKQKEKYKAPTSAPDLSWMGTGVIW